MLRSLSTADAADLHELFRANTSHLTRLGDYTTEVARDLQQWVDELAAVDPMLDFGIHEAGILVGRVALTPVAPPRYGCGYLLAEGACGRGLATLALRAVTDHARTSLRATDVYAGVTHGNVASMAVLRRVGFQPVAIFPEYVRYQLTWWGCSRPGDEK